MKLADISRLPNPEDNCAIAVQRLEAGTELLSEAGSFLLSHTVLEGHRFAIKLIEVGAELTSWGLPFGRAVRPLKAGDYVSNETMLTALRARHVGFAVPESPNFVDYFQPYQLDESSFCPAEQMALYEKPRTFEGYTRIGGRGAGTRNHVVVLGTSSLTGSMARMVAASFANARERFPNVDGVVALTMGSGCGMGSTGEGIDVLRRTLSGYTRHANFCGVLMVGLGCETNQISDLLSAEKLSENPLFQTFNIQDTGGTQKTVRKGVELIQQMLPHANQVVRTDVPVSHLTLGLQCGGSDGYSGISANPALGVAVDLLVQNGGTAILSETPEIYGAEHLLTRRAASPAVAEKLIERIHWWEDYCERNQGEMNNNPSAGNKAGGLTTILEKSLGAVAKGGTMRLEAVYEYAQPVTAKGFVYMDTPGYDPVSATGQVAGGANMICFTTGRGSAYGCAPTPSIKLSTNNALFKRQSEDIDINCGEIVDDGMSIAEKGAQIFELIIKVASGERTKSEIHGYGQSEFVPWQIGAVM